MSSKYTSVPPAGTANQILQKNSGADGDTSWAANISTATTADYIYQPSWWNMLAYTCPPALATTGSGSPGILGGWAYGAKIYFPANLTATSIIVDVTSLGTGGAIANCYVGLYDSSGTRLGVSAELSSNWATVGTKTHTLTADATGSLSITGGPGVYGFIVVLMGTQNTTTSFQLRTGEGNGSAAPNVGLAAGTNALRSFRWGNAALSSLPTSFNPLTATSLTASLLLWGAIR